MPKDWDQQPSCAPRDEREFISEFGDEVIGDDGICKQCDGTGETHRQLCKSCGGKGYLTA